MGICALVTVYNEEARIENCLKTLLWCDEILVLDKESTDRTREIAARYATKIITMPNEKAFSSSEVDLLLGHCQSEWVLFYTASDLIHPGLAAEIKALVSDPGFESDIIEIPFRRFVLGVGTRESPWASTYSQSIARRSVVKIRRGEVHEAIGFTSDKVHRIRGDGRSCMYHLTHESADRMTERHMRYWRGEAADPNAINLGRAGLQIVKCLYDIALRRRTLFRGRKGLALSFAYLSYYLMSYVYQWDAKYGDKDRYKRIAQEVVGAWEEEGRDGHSR